MTNIIPPSLSHCSLASSIRSDFFLMVIIMRFENFNLSRWIIHVTWLLLFWPRVYNYASAQTVTQPPANPDGLYTTIDPSMAIIILVLVSTFFIVAMFSIYVRHCSDSRAEGGALPSRSFAGLSRNRGLDPSVIESFPIFVYSAVKDLKIGKGALECAVCLSEFEDDETLRLLPKCDHVFHPHCIDVWLAAQVTCPVCRAKLTPESNEKVKLCDLNNESNQTHNNSASELSGEQSRVVIDINDEQINSDAQVLEITNAASQVTSVRNRPPRLGIPEMFPRSHSTGHSLVQAGVNVERYTLRFPDEVRKQLMMSGKLKRTVSFNAVLAMQGSSRKGGGGEGSGSSTGRNYVDRQGGRSDRWVFSMTPPFVSKMGFVKVGGEVTGLGEGWNSNGRNLLTAVTSPLNCLNVRIGHGGESSSVRPPGMN